MRRLAFALAAAFAAVGTPVRAQSPPARPITAEDYYRLKVAGNPELSPDGRWVAYSVGMRIEETNGTDSEVWIVPFDGSAPARRVSDVAKGAVVVSWTDDGRLRYVSSGRAITLDPAAPERVDSSAAPGGRGVQNGGATTLTSPDGKWIASVRDVRPPPRALTYRSEFERRSLERFKGVQFDWMEFHRDGAQFPTPNAADPQVNPPQEIFLAAAGNTDKAPSQLTRLALRPVGVQWSADGSKLLFSADSSYRNERVYGKTDIWTVTTDGVLHRVSPAGQYDYNGARFSPDGKWILATRQLSLDSVIAAKMTHGAPVDIVVLSANGDTERVLTKDWDYLPSSPQWNADGSYIYFTAGVGGTQHLFRVSPSGAKVEQVTSGERRLSGFSFDKTFTHMTYAVSSFEKPTELWAANIDGSGEHLLTHVNDDFVRDIALSRVERVQFTSKDGTPIEGWLTLPLGYRADGARYPLIVSSHGGPHSATEYNLSFRNHYLAANGYAVLETNFRSSTNYGEKFLWATWGAWGTKDGQDVMAGVDYVLAHYALDRARVATIGHSYGGFMTNWLITQYPDRFAAAIPGAGIVNWMSDYGNADIPRTKESEFFGGPWDAKARAIMLKQSPLTYAHRVKTPTLFINGEIDQRVPFSEAQQMYVALKKHGVPAKMIQYAGMPHSISGHWNVMHRMLSERAWLDQWLKPPTP
jgi:dipeptidyl aminopeptidase/acylaminoacyl peptidase